MTLDEAINHASEVAGSSVCHSCAAEHKQLAEWLKELKHLRTARDELASSLNEAVTIQSERCAGEDQFCSSCTLKEHSCKANKWKKVIEKSGLSETEKPQTEFPKETYTE